jgi:hypothetical protein
MRQDSMGCKGSRVQISALRPIVAYEFRENAEKLPVYSFLRTDKLSSRRCLGPRSIVLLLLRTYITWTPEADCSAPRAVAHADAGPAGLHR